MRTVPFLRCLIATLLLAALARADFAAEHAALEQELVASLVEHAAWCDEVGLDAERRRVLEAVLALDPDHAATREALGHKQQKDGSWKPPSREKKVADDPDSLDELRTRRIGAVAGYRDGLLALLEREAVAEEERERLLARVLELSPDDPEVRTLRGEVRLGDAWVLAETARAYDRRPEIRRTVGIAIRAAGLPGTLERGEPIERFGIEWLACARTPDVLVLGDVAEVEALRAAQAAHATGTVFRELFGSARRHYADYTLYLMNGRGKLEAFLAGVPELTDDERTNLARLVGSGIPRSADGAFWSDDARRRLDAAIRHTLGGFLRDEYGITTQQAWAWEGIGLYLTREIVGSRFTWYISAADADPALRGKLLDVNGNWIDAAWKLLRSKDAPDYAAVMSADASAMGMPGMLASYALSAYLLEGRPDVLPELLYRCGRGETPEVSVPGALGLELDELRPRIVRWLSERRRPEVYGL